MIGISSNNNFCLILNSNFSAEMEECLIYFSRLSFQWKGKNKIFQKIVGFLYLHCHRFFIAISANLFFIRYSTISLLKRRIKFRYNGKTISRILFIFVLLNSVNNQNWSKIKLIVQGYYTSIYINPFKALNSVEVYVYKRSIGGNPFC